MLQKRRESLPTYFGDLFRVRGARFEQFRLFVHIGRVDPVQFILRLLSLHKFAQWRKPLVFLKGVPI